MGNSEDKIATLEKEIERLNMELERKQLRVGQKIEEGDGSQQVQKLKEQLTKADLKKQRLMEAFKKTSHEFREVVYQLNGYRIDMLADHKYRHLPVYAESPEDSLLFQKSSEGEIQMLESGVFPGTGRPDGGAPGEEQLYPYVPGRVDHPAVSQAGG